jgi:hypothetical protein
MDPSIINKRRRGRGTPAGGWAREKSYGQMYEGRVEIWK